MQFSWPFPMSRLRWRPWIDRFWARSEEHTSELQSLRHLVCRLLLEKKNTRGDREQCVWNVNPGQDIYHLDEPSISKARPRVDKHKDISNDLCCAVQLKAYCADSTVH